MELYWESGKLQLWLGDMKEPEATLAALPVATVPLMLFSPPYNLGNSSGGGCHSDGLWNYGQQGKGGPRGHYSSKSCLGARGGSNTNRKWKQPDLANGYGEHDDAMPHEEYIAWQHRILRACWDKLDESGAIYYNHQPRIFDGELVEPTAYNPGLPLRQKIIWDRGGGVNFSEAFYLPMYQELLILAKPAWRLRDKSASGVGNVWSIPPEINTPHPAPFPLQLAKRVLSTNKPGLVLDCFCGWGTTLLAAQRLGLPAIGIDNCPRYLEMAARRLGQFHETGLFAPAGIVEDVLEAAAA